MSTLRRRLCLIFLLSCITLLLVPTPVLARQTTHVIDFTAHGQGFLVRKFFANEGIVFNKTGTYSSNYWVGYVQGDEALINDVYATFKRPITSLSIQVAPSSWGPIDYTLTAFSASGKVIASKTVTVSQPPFGYFTIDLGRLPAQAKSFAFTVANPGPGVGVSTITYTTGR